jgi:RNA polymerase sigma-70 factor (ECF subfamily)
MNAQRNLDYRALSDPDRCARPHAMRLVTQRNNQRLFRVALSILKNHSEAEDAVQSAYLRGIAAIGDYEGRASVSTWLTRITINEALGRARSERRRRAHLDGEAAVDLNEYRDKLMRGSMHNSAPDAELAQAQIRRILEGAVEKLPASFRLVFVLRDVEDWSIEETASAPFRLPEPLARQ